MDKTVVALLTGGGLGALAVVIQQLFSSVTTRKANEIAARRLEMEQEESRTRRDDALRKEDAERRAELRAERDEYRRALDAAEEELEKWRTRCGSHGNLCQLAPAPASAAAAAPPPPPPPTSL